VMRLVIGLGNPGPEYVATRHNVGFDVVDHLARREGLLFESSSPLEGHDGPAGFTFARSFDPEGLLVKPLSFMNRSGGVVAALARWADVPPEGVLVVVDDLDLPPARLRLRPHGGSGGHNGLKSIIESLGTDRFPRLRVGIGREAIDAALFEAAEAASAWLASGDIEACMTRFHSRWKPPEPGA
jgi:PTH1 family peptidyl-tRNA hydrolase